MPCFDKKLEASRRDFYHEDDAMQASEVDLVLTTIEVIEMIDEACRGAGCSDVRTFLEGLPDSAPVQPGAPLSHVLEYYA